MLNNQVDYEELKTLDLFGGTGSISYELASRGVPDLTIVEKDPKMHQFIKTTAESLQLENFKVVRSDVFQFMENCTEKYDLIFAGPPYALTTIDRLPEMVFERSLLAPGGWFILEHTPRNHYENFPGFLRSRNYGTTIFSIFEALP